MATTGFGEWLRREREAAGVSQRDLANAIGVKQPVLSRLENGLKVKLSRRQVEEIADALRVPEPEALEAAGMPSRGSILVRESDPLAAYGQIIDSAPYLYALQRVGMASAGTTERLVVVDAPTTDERPSTAYPVTAIRIRGTCMEPFVCDGEVALLLPPDAVLDGCVVTATVDALNIVCKRIRIAEGTSWLEPVNGETKIPEGRFIVTGVLADKVVPFLPPRNMEKEKPLCGSEG